MKREEPDDDSENSDNELPPPVGIGRPMPYRARDPKHAVDQHPGAEQYYQDCDSQPGIDECDYSEQNGENTPEDGNLPMTFQSFDKHGYVVAARAL